MNRLGDRIHSKTRRSQRGSSAGEMKAVDEFPKEVSVAHEASSDTVGFALITDLSADGRVPDAAISEASRHGSRSTEPHLEPGSDDELKHSKAAVTVVHDHSSHYPS